MKCLNIRFIAIFCVVILVLIGCDDKNNHADDTGDIESIEQGQPFDPLRPLATRDDKFWSNCAWVTPPELDTLDTLQQKLRNSTSLADDKITFQKYLNILTLKTKTDEQIENCAPSSVQDRARLMTHFVFLGLVYGTGEFSFVNNPRLASLFQMDYFYFYNDRNFLAKTVHGQRYSKSDRQLAWYLTGAMVVMQAAVKMQEKSSDAQTLVQELAKELSIIQYGKTRIFILLLSFIENKLNDVLLKFLFEDESFTNAFQTLQKNISKKIYPMFLRAENPYWPIDYSEVLGERLFPMQTRTVFGLNFGTSKGTPRGTGFFAKRNGKVLFISAGHGKFNRKVSIMKQTDPVPDLVGKQKSTTEWIDETLDIFNFAEELLVPTFKALEFTDAQIIKLKSKLGDNPSGSNFRPLFIDILPWIDMSIALPSIAVVGKCGTKPNDTSELGIAPDNVIGHIIGFGMSDDLVAGDYKKNKGVGFRRISLGNITHSNIEYGGNTVNRSVFFSPLKLEQTRIAQAGPFSLKLSDGFSGSPVFSSDAKIVGINQGDMTSKSVYIGNFINRFTEQGLALIDALISDPRGLHGIPKSDLVLMMKTHIFLDDTIRNSIKSAITSQYL